MTGLEQLQYLSWLLYIVIFISVLARALRRPTPAHIDMALFFGAAAVIVLASSVRASLRLDRPVWLAEVTSALGMALPYLLLRLVRDFSDVPALMVRAAAAGLAASIVAILLLPTPLPAQAVLVLVAYFLAVIGYDTWAFAREASHTRGVTRRRMQAVAAGSGCLGAVLLLAGLAATAPQVQAQVDALGILLGVASAVCYFVGFAPPIWLRRAWQEPELRAFLSRAASLPRLPDTQTIVRELEAGAAASLGAPAASIGLWDPDVGRLRFSYTPPAEGPAPPATAERVPPGTFARREGVWELEPGGEPIAGRAYIEQRAGLVMDVRRADPANAAIYQLYRARAALAAPITAGDKRLGVLAVFAPRAPIFANSDLELVQLLADQAAVILESRALIDQAARVRAREEATRLKDDFLSSAAHDLKTPLTGLVAQAQLLQRRADRDPTAPVDRVGLARLIQQSMRLKELVVELLDVSRLEQGSLIGDREELDLAALVQSLAQRESAAWERVRLLTDKPAIASVDRLRIEQVIANLVENGLKYSPQGGTVQVRVWADRGEVHLSVQDQGIGIPLEDQPLVFERFHRGRNVDDRRFAGLGLGLYIARGVVEQHGGRISVLSAPGVGSTFHVVLPTAAARAVPVGASGPKTAASA